MESNLNRFLSPSGKSSSSTSKPRLSSTRKLASWTRELNMAFKSSPSKSEETEDMPPSDLSETCLDLELEGPEKIRIKNCTWRIYQV